MLITEMLEIQHLLWRSERTHAECEGVRLDNANFKPKISYLSLRTAFLISNSSTEYMMTVYFVPGMRTGIFVDINGNQKFVSEHADCYVDSLHASLRRELAPLGRKDLRYQLLTPYECHLTIQHVDDPRRPYGSYEILHLTKGRLLDGIYRKNEMPSG